MGYNLDKELSLSLCLSLSLSYASSAMGYAKPIVDNAYKREREWEFFIDNLLVQIHVIIEMILVDWPCAMGV